MHNLTVKEWQDTIQQNKEIKLSSRFVANRVARIAGGDDVQKLKALKYLLLLIEFNGSLKVGRKGAKMVPMKDQLKTKLSNWPDALVENVRRRFADGGYAILKHSFYPWLLTWK